MEAEAVEFIRVWVEGVVEADGVGGDADLRVGGDEEAVGKAEVVAYEALVGDYQVTQSDFNLRLLRVSDGEHVRYVLRRSGLNR